MEELFLSSPYLSESVRKKIQKIIQEIESETELQAVALVSREGMRLACAETATIDADENSASVAAMLSIAQDTCRRMNEGRLIQVVVRGELGYTIMTRVSPETVLVAMSASQFNLGLYLRKLINYAYRIAEIIEETEKKPAPVVRKTTTPAVQSPKPTPVQPPMPQPVPQPVSEPSPHEEILFAKDIIEESHEEEKPPSIPKPRAQPVPAPTQKIPSPRTSVEPIKTPSTMPLPTSTSTPVPKPASVPTPTTSTAPAPAPVSVPRPPVTKPTKQERKPQVDEEERKAILEALRIIGMIGSEGKKK